MKNSDWCHLHVHNEHSMLDGFGTAENYAKKAKLLGFEYLGLTNHANIDGLIKFQAACEKEKIKPILGCEFYIVDKLKKERRRGHIVLFAKNQQGFENICRMLTFANTEGFYYRPRITYDLLKDNCEGNVITTACPSTFLKSDGGIELFNDLNDLIADDLYLELMPHNYDIQIETNNLALNVADKTGRKVIVSNDCHYINRGEYKIQEILLAMQRKVKWNDPKRWKFDIRGLHLKTFKEMRMTFKEQGFYKSEWFRNTLEIAEKCSSFKIEKRDIKLPRIKGIPKTKEKEYFKTICEKNFYKKFKKHLSEDRQYAERFKEEFDLINSKKFTRYFLIVWELIDWCKKNKILVGPGRGSVGGSLIAFLMGITTIDPILHDLLFSRFISEDRIDYPDIDIDFEHTKRHLVKKHLEEIYGSNKVAGVSSFNRMKAKAVIRDVSRVFEIPNGEVDRFSKLIEDNDENTGIQDAIDNYEEGEEFNKKYPDIIKYAKKLEGQVKGYSQHAAALVISQEDIGNSGRCNLLERDGVTLINWEKDDTEYVGLMKLDSLALKLLSTIGETLNLIYKNHDKNINLEKINLNDKEVLREVDNGHTVGLFQMSTWATTALIKEMGISDFTHMSDAVALVRPGPTNSGITRDYIKRKHGARWKKKHKIYEKIMKDTYGLPVYQEQIMSVIKEVAGLPYSTADKIRKIIGKKRDRKEFEAYEKQFLEGCAKEKIFDKEEASEFWRELQEWAKYGFNKCTVGTTIIERANFNQYTGKYVTVKDLYINWNKGTSTSSKYSNKKRGLTIMQVDSDGSIRPGKVKGIYYNGKRLVYTVITEGGRFITATRNHKLLTYNGYKQIQQMTTDDWLAVKGNKNAQSKRATTILGYGWSKGKKWKNGKPPEKDRRTIYFKNAKLRVYKRAKGICENCGKTNDKRFEFAHIKSIAEMNNDYKKYHNKNNLKFLCNGCHKKMDSNQRGWFKKGYGIAYDKIVDIKFDGIEDVFDIEMDSENHNFIANGIVSHNSHSVGYAILAYWCAWLKKYYPTEFISASLTYGADNKKSELVEEAYRLGLTLVLPKVTISSPTKWVASGNKLYIPFKEVKGIGDKKAVEAAQETNKKGITKFFTKKSERLAPKHKGKFGELLESIDAYNPDENTAITEQMQQLFKFRIVTNPRDNYKNLYNLFNNKLRLDKLDDVLAGDYKTLKTFAPNGLIHKQEPYEYPHKLLQCESCELFKECTRPVPPSGGELNIMMIGQDPGFEEDKEGQGFIGRSGKEIWKLIESKGYKREQFHITNICKCYPSSSKKGSPEQIKTCTKLYLKDELLTIKPKVVLAFGNANIQFFMNRGSGIINLSGRTTWNEEYTTWIAWCLHPAAVLHNPDNKSYYEAGMKNFFKLLHFLGLRGIR